MKTAERNGADHAEVTTVQAATTETPGTNGEQASPRIQKAEQIADRITGSVGWFASATGEKMRYLAARTREVVSDFWAEVQDVRRGEGAQDSPK